MTQEAAVAPDRAPGEEAGDYVIESLLGQGSMGVVYKARPRAGGASVAIKFPLRLSERDMPGYLARFHNEAKIALGLRHPNIVAVHEVASDGRDTFMVMEYVDGKTLAEVLERRPVLAAAPALQIALQAARGLEAVHACGVVHRDFKPSNLMLAAGGVAKIADFGVAKMRHRSRDDNQSDLEGEIVGTPFYLSPEQTLGHRTDHRVDIYALGVTLFRMFTGRFPFNAQHRWELFRMILDSPVPSIREFNPEASPSADRIVRRAMAKRPVDRQPTAAHLAAEIQSAIRELASAPKIDY